ncbi:transcriptional regulator [Aegicerativicinus sediminis]
MIAVLTGDIIKSQEIAAPSIWLDRLKIALNFLSKEEFWSIYRGDSFQLEIGNPRKAFIAAIYIKACIKTIKDLDIRIAIGLGNKEHQGKDVSESNGPAFVYSGETLEQLKKEKTNLKLKSDNPIFNDEINLYFKLLLIGIDHWTVNSAEVVKLTIENPNMLQTELAKLIGTSQNAVSKRQKRANLDEIFALDKMYNSKLKKFL